MQRVSPEKKNLAQAMGKKGSCKLKIPPLHFFNDAFLTAMFKKTFSISPTSAKNSEAFNPKTTRLKLLRNNTGVIVTYVVNPQKP